MTDEVRSKVEQAKQVIGIDLYAFMLGIHTSKLDQLQPSAAQLCNIDTLDGYTEKLRDRQGFERASVLEQVFCAYFDEIDTSRATYFHFTSLGRAVPTIKNTKDRLLDDIITIARDVFPALLIDRGEHGGAGLFLPTYSHTLRDRVTLAMIAESCPIRKLFPGIEKPRYYKDKLEELWSVRSHAILSNGSFSQISLSSLTGSILASAVYAPHDDLDPLFPYLRSVKSQYQKIKRLASGGQVDHTVLLGLGNIDIDESIYTIDLSDATIRRISHLEKNAVFGRDNVDASVVVELKEKVKILELYIPTKEDDENPFARFEKYSKYFNERFEGMQQRINRVRLATILASSSDRVIAPSHSFTTSFSLLDMNRSWNTNPYRWPSVRYERAILNAEDVRQITYWAKKTMKIPKSLDVSVKRLISSMTERIDDSDAFIDAVMVWENLFGAKEETGLRIRSSIALLLEPRNKVERLKIIKEIKGLYEKRSRLVHGSPDVKLDKISEDRHNAIDYALRSFKKVLRSKKLIEAKDSTERGHMIIYR